MKVWYASFELALFHFFVPFLRFISKIMERHHVPFVFFGAHFEHFPRAYLEVFVAPLPYLTRHEQQIYEQKGLGPVGGGGGGGDVGSPQQASHDVSRYMRRIHAKYNIYYISTEYSYHTHDDIKMCTYIYIYIHIYLSMYVYILLITCKCVLCTYIHIYLYFYVYIYYTIYIYTYIHTYIHTCK